MIHLSQWGGEHLCVARPVLHCTALYCTESVLCRICITLNLYLVQAGVMQLNQKMDALMSVSVGGGMPQMGWMSSGGYNKQGEHPALLFITHCLITSS